MKKTANPWSVPVAVDDIPDTGLHMAIEAPAAVRAELAELADVRDLPRLSAVFDLTRQGAEVRVTGQVSARVGQTCVVTLEPLESAIERGGGPCLRAGQRAAGRAQSRAQAHAATTIRRNRWSAAAWIWARWRPNF